MEEIKTSRLLISLKENVKEGDSEYFDAIYHDYSSCYPFIEWRDGTSRLFPALELHIRDECLFDQFMESFKEFKNVIPGLESLTDLWLIIRRDRLVYQNPEIGAQLGIAYARGYYEPKLIEDFSRRDLITGNGFQARPLTSNGTGAISINVPTTFIYTPPSQSTEEKIASLRKRLKVDHDRKEDD